MLTLVHVKSRTTCWKTLISPITPSTINLNNVQTNKNEFFPNLLTHCLDLFTCFGTVDYYHHLIWSTLNHWYSILSDLFCNQFLSNCFLVKRPWLLWHAVLFSLCVKFTTLPYITLHYYITTYMLFYMLIAVQWDLALAPPLPKQSDAAAL